MYQTFFNLIKANNTTYEQLNSEVHRLESLYSDEDVTEVQNAKFTRWQFIHNYADQLDELIWHNVTNLTNLTKTDLSVFDLVPYIVWNKLSEKSLIIVNNIITK